MKLWSAFYDLAVPDLPGCPLTVLDVALREAAIVFCERSMAWRYDHDDIAVVAGTASYDFVPPAGAVVHTVRYATYNDEEIAVNVGESDIWIQDWRNASGTPKYLLGGESSLTLVPNPDVDGTLTLKVTLKPSSDATGIDDAIYRDYRQTIVHGALSRLMISPKKPYTDTNLATYHHQLFIIEMGGAGIKTARNHTRAPLRTTIMRRG